MNAPTQLTIDETKRVIADFSSLVSGPEHGVASNQQLREKVRELRSFLAEKGYITSEYDLETKYRCSA